MGELGCCDTAERTDGPKGGWGSVSPSPSLSSSLSLSLLSIYLSTYLPIYTQPINLLTYLPIITYLSIYLSVCLSVCLVVCLSIPIYLSICLPACLPVYLSIWLDYMLSIFLFICLSVCLCIYLSETKQFCQTSSKSETSQLQNDEIRWGFPVFELDSAKNEAILRDYFNFWIAQRPKRRHSMKFYEASSIFDFDTDKKWSNPARTHSKMASWVQSWEPRANAFCDFPTPSV